MHSWPVQDAKARFSEMLDTCLREGPQTVTRRGVGEAMLVPMKDWDRLHQRSRRTLKELLLMDAARADLAVPARGGPRRRPTLKLV